MNEDHLPDGSGSQEILWLRAKGGDEVRRLVAVTALGMCRALASAIADVEAELLTALADLAPSDLAGEKWLVRAP